MPVNAIRTLDERANRIPKGAALGVLTIVASMAAAGLLLAHTYGLRRVGAAVAHADPRLLVLVVALGIVDQLIRARRAQLMLSHDREVPLQASYGAMVVGHGVGDLVPFVPGGPLLRSVLTERLAGIPIPFSAGVYMLEGILDGLGPALLIGYLLLALAVPGWIRVILIGALAQSLLMLLLPVLCTGASQLLPSLRSERPALKWLARFGAQIAHGLQGLMSRGLRVSLPVVGLSLAVTALAAIQMTIFLRAFGLSTSVNDLFLLLVLTLTSGSIPVKIPGFGTLTTAAVLPVAGIHGPGLAGYVLISRVVFSSETVALAAVVLSWWTVTRNRCLMELSAVFRPPNRKSPLTGGGRAGRFPVAFRTLRRAETDAAG